jgi:hypothetical protein
LAYFSLSSILGVVSFCAMGLLQRIHKSRPIHAAFLGAASAVMIILVVFLLLVFWLAGIYTDVTGSLVHPDRNISRALFHVFCQACAFGGAGGFLFVLQIILKIANSNESWFSPRTTPEERFLIAFLIPFKGVIAGAITCGIVGGAIFVLGNLEAFGRAHLLILGICGAAGYSEKILQEIVNYGRRHTR